MERTWLEHCCLLNIGDTLFPELVPRLCITLQMCGIPLRRAVDAKMAENLDI